MGLGIIAMDVAGIDVLLRTRTRWTIRKLARRIEHSGIGLYRPTSTAALGLAVHNSGVRSGFGRHVDCSILLAMVGHRSLRMVGLVEV